MSENKNNNTGNLKAKTESGKPKNKKELSIYEEEKVQSPFRTMMRMFFTRKLTILGLSVFGFVLLCCIVLPFFFPMDRFFMDSTQRNLPPGFNYQNMPAGIVNDAKLIGVGNNFAAGVNNAGEVFVWGNASDGLLEIPEGMGNIVQISCGLTQITALNDQGEAFTWGNDQGGIFRLLEVPVEVQNANIVQVVAGDQISAALDDEGNVHVWGNQNIVSIRASSVRGQVKQIALNNLTGLALLNDGSVVCMTNQDLPFSHVPEEVQGRAIEIASNDKAAAALLDDGTVVAWGLADYGLLNVPEEIQGRVTSISGGRAHFTVLLDDGSVAGWGLDVFDQASPPSLNNAKAVESGYYQNYAIDNDNKVVSWGLRGYMFGTDDMGRDVFSRLWAGGRISLSVGALAILLSAFIGVIIGSIAGFFGGKTDLLLMRLAEVWASIPFLPVAIILSYILAGKFGEMGRLLITMLILGILGWPGIARLVRAQMLMARENDYVLAARATGVETKNIIFRHIFPNILTVVAVNLMLSLAGSILTESSLSYLGLGIMEPTPTWGNMLNSSVNVQVITNYWWRWLFPAIALSLSTLSLNIIGDGLREAVDPKAAGR